MDIYIILLLSILLIPKIDKAENELIEYRKLKSQKYTFVVLAFMILIPGLRDVSIGIDTFQYKYMFDEYSVGFDRLFKLGVRTEEGYLVLNKLIHDIFGNFSYMLTAVSMSLILPAYWIVYKYSHNIWLSLALIVVFIFYYTCFNEMRLCVALGVSCVAFHQLVIGNWKRYLLFVILAFFFHHSAMIVLPLVVVRFFDRLKTWHILLLVVGYIFVSYNMASLYTILNSFQENTYGINEETGGFGLLALQVLTLTLAFYKRKDLFVDNYNLYAFYFVAAAVLLFPICHANPVMFRLEQYCWLPMIILVPNTIRLFSRKTIRICAIIAYLSLGYLFLFLHSFSESNQIIPYKFFWQ